MAKPEFKLCCAFYKWWSFFSRTAGLDPRDLYHIANQGTHGSPKTGSMLKSLGVVSGVSDYHLAVPVAPYHGLYLEAKSATGRPSPEQLADHELRRKRGYQVVIFRSIDDAISAITKYLQPNTHPPA